MLDIAQTKMPDAELICYDFTQGLPPELAERKFDFVVMTYSLHHLDDEQKLHLFNQLSTMLRPDGMIIIGDVAFETEAAQDACAAQVGEEWDDEEIYLVMSKISPHLEKLDYSYRQISHCAGILALKNPS